uniref:Aminoacyl tRNA synthetase class I n=1 Tax=Echinococcus granulosus TaxID=6210 RepID=A0A068WQ26_ECHGR|nr:Aminoacyl tRNA synthetase class I [Echinococcus granulosus]
MISLLAFTLVPLLCIFSHGNMTTAGLHDSPVLKEGGDSTLPQLGFDRPKRRRTHQAHTVILLEGEKVSHQPVTSEDLFTRPQEISYSEDHLSCREEGEEDKRTVLPVRPTNGIALPVIPTGGVILKSRKNPAPEAENKAPGNQNGVPPTRPKEITKGPEERTSKSEIAPASDKPKPITPDRPSHYMRSISLGNAYGDGRKGNRQEHGNVSDERRSTGLLLYKEYQVTEFKKQPPDTSTEGPNNDKAFPSQKPSTPTETVKNGAHLHKEQRKDISSEKKERDNVAKRQSDACEYQNLPASTCARTMDSQPSVPQGPNNAQNGRDSEVLVSVGPSELPTAGGADAEEEDEKKKKKAQQNTGRSPPHSNSSTIFANTNASNTSMGGKASPESESTAANKAFGEYAMPAQQDNAAKSQSDAQSKPTASPRQQKAKPGGVASSQLSNSGLAAAEEEDREKNAQHNMRKDHQPQSTRYKKAEERTSRKSRWYQMSWFRRHRRPNLQASKSEGDLSQAVDGSQSRSSKTLWQRVRELFTREPMPTLDLDDSAEEEQQQQQQHQHQRQEKKPQNEPLLGQDERAGKRRSAPNPLKKAVGTIV